MTFAAPIWLLAVLPWTAIVAYLLRAIGQRATVPFLMLWPRSEAMTKHSSRRLPPIWITLMCLASLLVILAAAGPTWIFGKSIPRDLSIVIDRGITMSGDTRYRALVKQGIALIGQKMEGTTITLLSVPGRRTIVADGSWARAALALPPTAVATHTLIQSAVASELSDSRGQVIVLSDQPLDRTDPRLIQIAPDEPLRNIGITALAAQALPHPQVMVRLENVSREKSVRLRIQSGSNTIDRKVNLTGKFTTEFIDLPSFGDTIRADLVSPDDVPADDAGWLTLQRTGVTLNLVGDLAPEVARIAQVYMHRRPSGRQILVSTDPLPADQPGVQIVSSTHDIRSAAALQVTIDPITTAVKNWPDAAAEVQPPNGFRVIVQREEQALVAVHPASPRQVWINLNVSNWSRTTDFVIFFSNVFESFRDDGADEFTSTTPVALGPEWKRINDIPAPPGIVPGLWPGLYRSDDGRQLAVNSTASLDSLALLSLTERNPNAIAMTQHREVSLAPVVCWAALTVSAIALALWPIEKRPEPRALFP